MNWDHMRYIGSGLSVQEIDLDAFISTLGSKYIGSAWSQWTGESAPKNAHLGTTFPYAHKTIAKEEDRRHYYEKDRFTWPYDAPSAPLDIEVNITLKKTKNANRDFSSYIEIQNSEGKTVELFREKDTKYKRAGWTGNYKLNNITLQKGDSIHARQRAYSTGGSNYLRTLKVQVVIRNIRLTDWKGTVELDRQLLTTYGTVNQKGGMVAEKKMQGSDWRRYIEEGDFYDQPHLTEYNELFSGKVSSTIKKTV